MYIYMYIYIYIYIYIYMYICIYINIGSLRIPAIQEHVRTYVDSHGVSHTKEISNDYDDYDNYPKNDLSNQKLNKHRIATNKKRRKNKNKIKNKFLNLHYNDSLFDNHNMEHTINCKNLNEKKYEDENKYGNNLYENEYLIESENIHENENFNKNGNVDLYENDGNDKKVRFSVNAINEATGYFDMNNQSKVSVTGMYVYIYT
jgi:hypothetical protein